MDNNLTYIKERILYYAEKKGISKESFVESIGMTYGNFKGSNKYRPLNSDAIESILSIHSDLNPEWLLTGKGAMLKTTSPQEYPNIDISNRVAEPPNEYTSSHSKDVDKHFKQLEEIQKKINKESSLLKLLEDNSKLVDANVKLANANLLLAETNALLSKELISHKSVGGKDTPHTADAV